MADFDSQLPVRSEAANNETRIADSTNAVINPATEETVAAIETEVLDQGTSLDAIVTDAAAIEAELLDQGTALDALVVDAAAIEAELLDQGTSLDSVVTDLAAIEVEQLAQGTSLDSLVTDAAAIETELLDQGTSLDALVADLAAIETELLDQGLTLDAIAAGVNAAGGTNVDTYNTAAAVASNASNTQTYTPAANFLLQRIEASASGQMKVEVQYGPTGSEVTKAVKFTSKGDLNVDFVWDDPLLVTTAQTVKVIRTNLDNQAQDVYSTIKGKNA